jgi:DNA-binding GntR family transcriptional regulator
MPEPLLTRRRARDDVRDLLKTMIGDGSLPGGTRLDEMRLSRRIGVSRTPLREALIAMEAEGLVRSAPNRGFIVVRADAELVREIYPIKAALESAALRLGADEARARVSELRAINGKLAAETSKLKMHRLDAQFHDLLLAGCKNERLMAMVDTFRVQAARVDGAHKRGMADRDGSCRQHEAVLEALEAGDYDAAETRLRTHFRLGSQVVVKWLEENT